MDTDPPRAVARHFERIGLVDPHTVAITPGPTPLFDPLATAPYAFYQAVPRGRAAPSHPLPEPICVMVDTRDGRVHHRDPHAFGEVACELDLGRRPDRFSPDEWLAMVYVLCHGEPPVIAFAPPADAAPDAHIEPAAVERRGDGAIVITGWTLHDRGRRFTRHRVTVAADGAVELDEESR